MMRYILTLVLLITGLCACSASSHAHSSALVDAETPPSCLLQNITDGIDVSNYQPNVNWADTAADGVQFSFIKATEGVSIVDPDFATAWPAARFAGVLRSAYHFFHATDDPSTQAQNFLNTVGELMPDDLAPMFDWETSDGVATATVIQNAQTWLDAVETATGRTPIIYTNASYWQTLGNPAAFARYPLFIVDLEKSCPTVPAPWTTWTFWQYSEGSLSGVPTTVDFDVYNGSFSQLMNMIVASPP
jgi:lysozyme